MPISKTLYNNGLDNFPAGHKALSGFEDGKNNLFRTAAV